MREERSVRGRSCSKELSYRGAAVEIAAVNDSAATCTARKAQMEERVHNRHLQET